MTTDIYTYKSTSNLNFILMEDFGSLGTYAIDPRDIKGPPAFGGGKVFGTKELVSTDGSTCNCNCATSIDSVDLIKSDVSDIKLKLAQLIDQLQGMQNSSQPTPDTSGNASAGGMGVTPPPPPSAPAASMQPSSPQGGGMGAPTPV